MNLYLLSFLFIWNTAAAKTPNFYPSYIAAKEASKNYQKDLLIFFSKNSCSECDIAWSNFEKDQLATKIFISTLIDMQDFDGAVIMDKYGLNAAPSWVILDSEGKVKQKWTGEWKNPHIRPSQATSEEIAKPATKPASNPVVQSNPAASINPPAPAVVAPAKPMPPISTETKAENPAASTTMMTNVSKIEVVATGYVLQAGYFGSEANALKLVNDLKGKGFDQYAIKTISQNGSTFYRVISKTYSSESEANQEVQAMSVSGITASVKKLSEI